ncbi:hypothetical protein LCGC14_1249520 [marine sediment metagenome]|uniref:Uncharacterized protein n=1 Tax=marine sediment metagenome TaxID=412755 RepID=A0A0F9P7G8_9ZZZZ
MIPFRGVEGIRNLYLDRRCDVCGKKRKTNIGTDCVRCVVWTKGHWHYLIMKYIRFSIRKYLYSEMPKPRAIPSERADLVGKYNA